MFLVSSGVLHKLAQGSNLTRGGLDLSKLGQKGGGSLKDHKSVKEGVHLSEGKKLRH